MDPDTEKLVTVARAHAKALRRQASTFVRLLAELDERLAREQESTAQPEEAERNGSQQHT